MDRQIVAAVKGAVVGMTLGSQRHGSDFYTPISFYTPIPSNPVASAALDAWLVWAEAMNSDVHPTALSALLERHWTPDDTESAFGLVNVKSGLSAPLSGAHSNPLSHGASALGRCIFWGLVHQGMPDTAAEKAYWDASIDHDKEGVWIPVATAYALAALTPGDDAKRFVDAFVYALPRQSRLRGAIPLIVRSVAEPDGARKLHGMLADSLGVADPLSSVLAGACVIYALTASGGSFESCVCETAAFGGASIHSTMACGAAAALLAGDVPSRWTDPIEQKFSCGTSLRGLSLPKGLNGLIEVVASLAPSPHVEVVPSGESTEHATVAPTQLPLVPLPLDVAQEPNFMALSYNGASVLVYYHSSPTFAPAETTNLSISFVNTSGAPLDFAPRLTPPPGWECAHKVTSFTLLTGASATFPVVLRCKSPELIDYVLEVEIAGETRTIPLLSPQRWYRVGPLLNQEGTGFDREYPAQRNIALGAYFNGRSDMPVEWRETLERTCQFDVESLMAGGPGTAYYFARVRFPAPGRFGLRAGEVLTWRQRTTTRRVA